MRRLFGFGHRLDANSAAAEEVHSRGEWRNMTMKSQRIGREGAMQSLQIGNERRALATKPVVGFLPNLAQRQPLRR